MIQRYKYAHKLMHRANAGGYVLYVDYMDELTTQYARIAELEMQPDDLRTDHAKAILKLEAQCAVLRLEFSEYVDKHLELEAEHNELRTRHEGLLAWQHASRSGAQGMEST